MLTSLMAMARVMKLLRINARLPQPRISSSLHDPLGSAVRINKIDREIKKKYAQLNKTIIDLFKSIPSGEINSASAGNYYYDFSSSRAAGFLDELQRLLDDVLVEGESSGRMWAGLHVQDAYQSGTAKANSELASLSAAYADSRPLAVILYSQPYMTRLQLAYTKTYSDWRGLSDYSRQQLASTIMEGIARGDNPRNIESLIAKRLDVSKTYARQIAQTEITNTLREANRREVAEAKATLGLNTTMLWMSALMVTTRKTHASRHGKFYETEEIDLFYSEGGNRYNCHCAQTPALIMNGEPVILESSQKRLDDARDKWDKLHGAKK